MLLILICIIFVSNLISTPIYSAGAHILVSEMVNEKIGELREGYIARWKKYPEDEVKIRVARPSVLAPSKDLLSYFMMKKKAFMKYGSSELEGRKSAWIAAKYEERFRKEMASFHAVNKLGEIIKLLLDGVNVRLLCYEKEPPCHRFILMDIIREMMI